MSTLARLVLVPASLVVAAPAAAQPEPEQVLRAASDAMRNVAALTCTASAEGVGAMAAHLPDVTATLTLARAQASDRLGWRFVIDARWAAPGADPVAYRAAYDGAAFRSVSDADRKLVEADPRHARALLGAGPDAVLDWALRWPALVGDLFGGEEPRARARYEGKVTVAGVPCHVVHADYADMPDPRLYGAWWYIAESDSLPRRVDFHFYDNDSGDGFLRVTLAKLDVVPAPEPAAFALSLPDGYELVKYQPPARADDRPRAARPRPQGLDVGSPAPDWALKDPAGKEHRLADYRGKLVVMDFWATWCGPCRLAMPGLQKIHEKYKDRGVTVFGVNAWESGDPAAYMKDNGFSYGLLLDADQVAADYGVTGIPAFFIVGTDGKLIFTGVGYSPDHEKAMERVISQHLADR